MYCNLLFLLLACTSSENAKDTGVAPQDSSQVNESSPLSDSDPGDSDPGDSDPGDSDPGDSDPGDSSTITDDGLPDLPADCALSMPWVAGDRDDVLSRSSQTTPIAEMISLSSNAESVLYSINLYSENTCPLRTEDKTTGAVTYSGDCVYSFPHRDDVTSEGSITFLPNSEGIIAEGFSFSYDSYLIVMDGTYISSGTFGEADYMLTIDLSYDVAMEVITAKRTMNMWVAADGTTLSGAGYVLQEDGDNPGDFCFGFLDEGVTDCRPESDYTLLMQGANTAIFQTGGETECDNCADISVDGVALEPLCY